MVPITRTIEITAIAEHLREYSDSNHSRFAFGYTITIKNRGDTAVRLLNRYWIITNANGEKQTIQGKGVVGKQPLIPPGQSYRYSSGTLLSTPVGTMQGSYKMIDTNGVLFDAIIPPFRLAKPELVN
tara:strand:+ start:11707 stop:12087 length:381 start_codon:yes stop_codon:yes gene_type:complete